MTIAHTALSDRRGGRPRPNENWRFSNPMRKFHSGKRDRSIPERLEADHGRAPSLDRTVVLLDDVVEVLASPNLNMAPDGMLAPQSP